MADAAEQWRQILDPDNLDIEDREEVFEILEEGDGPIGLGGQIDGIIEELLIRDDVKIRRRLLPRLRALVERGTHNQAPGWEEALSLVTSATLLAATGHEAAKDARAAALIKRWLPEIVKRCKKLEDRDRLSWALACAAFGFDDESVKIAPLAGKRVAFSPDQSFGPDMVSFAHYVAAAAAAGAQASDLERAWSSFVAQFPTSLESDEVDWPAFLLAGYAIYARIGGGAPAQVFAQIRASVGKVEKPNGAPRKPTFTVSASVAAKRTNATFKQIADWRSLLSGDAGVDECEHDLALATKSKNPIPNGELVERVIQALLVHDDKDVRARLLVPLAAAHARYKPKAARVTMHIEGIDAITTSLLLAAAGHKVDPKSTLAPWIPIIGKRPPDQDDYVGSFALACAAVGEDKLVATLVGARAKQASSGRDPLAFARYLTGAAAVKASTAAAERAWSSFVGESSSSFVLGDLLLAGYGYYTRIERRKPRDVLSAITEHARYFAGM